jgi:hypothetical protein
MSEHAHSDSEAVHSDPTLSAGPPSTCDVSQAGPCSQITQECELEHHSMQDIVSDCMPDGQGGCQRSAPGSPSSCCSPACLDSARGTSLQVISVSGLRLIAGRPIFLGPCCQSDSDVCELSCQDGRCLGSSPPCALDSPSTKECHRGRSYRPLCQRSRTNMYQVHLLWPRKMIVVPNVPRRTFQHANRRVPLISGQQLMGMTA